MIFPVPASVAFVIVTPLAYDEFAAAGDNYQKMIDASAAMRSGSSDEIAQAGEFLLGEHAGFINGTDLMIDGLLFLYPKIPRGDCLATTDRKILSNNQR